MRAFRGPSFVASIALIPALAAAQAPAAPQPAMAPAVDPAALTAEALASRSADRAGFDQENADLLGTYARWNQDPALGVAECQKARQDPRSCMGARLEKMGKLLKPEALGIINSYMRLLPRGVSARVPGQSGPEAEAAGGAPTAAPAGAPAPRPATSPSGRTPGLKVSDVPATAPPPAAGAPPKTFKDDWVDAWCRYWGC